MRLSWRWMGPAFSKEKKPVEQATGARLTMPQRAQMRERTWMTKRDRGWTRGFEEGEDEQKSEGERSFSFFSFVFGERKKISTYRWWRTATWRSRTPSGRSRRWPWSARPWGGSRRPGCVKKREEGEEEERRCFEFFFEKKRRFFSIPRWKFAIPEFTL